jgi:hypothetical protein
MWAFFPKANTGSVESAKAPGAPLYRRLLAAMLVAGTIIGGFEVHRSLESPGRVIRDALIQAGSAIAALPWSTPSESVRQRVLRHFPSYRATVDAAGFPAYVTVTQNDLDYAACRDAYRLAERIEGYVVIAIEGPGETVCRDHAVITWRIMP